MYVNACVLCVHGCVCVCVCAYRDNCISSEEYKLNIYQVFVVLFCFVLSQGNIFMSCDESRPCIFMSACPEPPLGRWGHVLPSSPLPRTSQGFATLSMKCWRLLEKLRSGREQCCRETLTGMEGACYLRGMMDKGLEEGT